MGCRILKWICKYFNISNASLEAIFLLGTTLNILRLASLIKNITAKHALLLKESWELKILANQNMNKLVMLQSWKSSAIRLLFRELVIYLKTRISVRLLQLEFHEHFYISQFTRRTHSFSGEALNKHFKRKINYRQINEFIPTTASSKQRNDKRYQVQVFFSWSKIKLKICTQKML